MHSTPSEELSQAPRKRVGNTSTRVMATIVVISASALAAIRGCDTAEPSAGAPAPIKAPKLDDQDVRPVSALKIENMVGAIADTVSVQSVSLEKKVSEALVQKGPRTIAELPEGEIPHGTEIKLVDGNWDVFILATAENGDILVIDGQRFAQSALASKKTAFGALPLGEHEITWRKLEKSTVDGVARVVIHGGQKGEEPAETDEVSVRGSEDLATLCRNAKTNGKFQFAIPSKKVTGVGEVTLVGQIKRIEK